MTANPVQFGTDGWRAIIGETFTFDNVRACAQAVADHFADTYGKEKPVVIGFDTRFLSDEFALAAARVEVGGPQGDGHRAAFFRGRDVHPRAAGLAEAPDPEAVGLGGLGAFLSKTA